MRTPSWIKISRPYMDHGMVTYDVSVRWWARPLVWYLRISRWIRS